MTLCTPASRSTSPAGTEVRCYWERRSQRCKGMFLPLRWWLWCSKQLTCELNKPSCSFFFSSYCNPCSYKGELALPVCFFSFQWCEFLSMVWIHCCEFQAQAKVNSPLLTHIWYMWIMVLMSWSQKWLCVCYSAWWPNINASSVEMKNQFGLLQCCCEGDGLFLQRYIYSMYSTQLERSSAVSKAGQLKMFGPHSFLQFRRLHKSGAFPQGKTL